MQELFNQLLDKYLTHSITTEEREQLFAMIASRDYEQYLQLIMDSQFAASAFAGPEDLELRNRLYEQLKAKRSVKRTARLFTLRKIAVAASILLLLGAGYWFLIERKADQPEITYTITADVKAPDKTKATITLANGQTIYLDSSGTGTIFTQGNVAVLKNANGEIVYNGSSDEVVFNTLYNPRGSRVVSLTLNDGTKVWLNAESSLKYPIAFTGNERKVEITGEAYFEVAKDASKKFLVDAKGVVTEVIGTHFNINSYADESDIKVTLLEGSVKVRKDNASGLLKPGEQAKVNSEIKIVKDIDLEEVMAWKNGRFQFEGAGIEEVMRQIARWYDVEVVYESKPLQQHFRGSISRNVEASKVFKMLETTEAVHFRIEGKKVIVMP